MRSSPNSRNTNVEDMNAASQSHQKQTIVPRNSLDRPQFVKRSNEPPLLLPEFTIQDVSFSFCEDVPMSQSMLGIEEGTLALYFHIVAGWQFMLTMYQTLAHMCPNYPVPAENEATNNTTQCVSMHSLMEQDQGWMWDPLLDRGGLQ